MKKRKGKKLFMNSQNSNFKSVALLSISKLLKEARQKKPEKVYIIDLFNSGVKLNSKTVTDDILTLLEKFFKSQAVTDPLQSRCKSKNR